MEHKVKLKWSAKIEQWESAKKRGKKKGGERKKGLRGSKGIKYTIWNTKYAPFFLYLIISAVLWHVQCNLLRRQLHPHVLRQPGVGGVHRPRGGGVDGACSRGRGGGRVWQSRSWDLKPAGGTIRRVPMLLLLRLKK